MRLVARVATLEPPDPADAGVEVWRDVNGTLAAMGYRDGMEHCVHVPNVGTFRFTASSDEIELCADESASAYLQDDAFHRIAVPLALQLRATQVLHASAVVLDSGVVALCGRSGAGKSTLAYSLNRRGAPLWGDDAVAFSPVEDRIQVSPMPFRMRLRPASAVWFDDHAHEKGSGVETPWHGASDPAYFRALFVLHRRPEDDAGDPAIAIRLDPADAFSAVLPHAYYLALDDEELNRRLLSAYLVLAERLPVFALTYTPQLGLLDEITEVVEATVRGL